MFPLFSIKDLMTLVSFRLVQAVLCERLLEVPSYRKTDTQTYIHTCILRNNRRTYTQPYIYRDIHTYALHTDRHMYSVRPTYTQRDRQAHTHGCIEMLLLLSFWHLICCGICLFRSPMMRPMGHHPSVPQRPDNVSGPARPAPVAPAQRAASMRPGTIQAPAGAMPSGGLPTPLIPS